MMIFHGKRWTMDGEHQSTRSLDFDSAGILGIRAGLDVGKGSIHWWQAGSSPSWTFVDTPEGHI